jgi:hypothetical protein
VIIDSFKNVFPFFTIGKEYRFNNILFNNFDIAIGGNLFAGYKKINNYIFNTTTNKYISKSQDYTPLLGITPTIKFLYKKVSINLYISPRVELTYKEKNYYAEGFFYTTFGYKF